MLILLLSLIAIIAATILFYKNHKLAIFCLVFLLPFERIGSYSVSGHNLRVVQLALIAYILAHLPRLILVMRRKLKASGQWWLLGFILSTAVTSAIINTPRFWQNYITMVFLAVGFIAVAVTVQKDDLIIIRRAILASTLAVAVFGIWQFAGDMAGLNPHLTAIKSNYSHLVLGITRVHSVANEPLYLANFLTIPLMLGLSIFLTKKNRLQTWEFISWVLAAVVFILTLSRGAFAGLAVGIAILIAILIYKKICDYYKLLWLAAITVSLAALAIVLVVFAGPKITSQNAAGNQFLHNFLNPQKITQTFSFIDRQNRISAAREAWSHSKLFGLGLGRLDNTEGKTQQLIQNLPKRYGYDSIATFNFYWELLAESGIFGFILFAGFVITIISRNLMQIMKSKSAILVWLAFAFAVNFAIFIQAYTFSGFFLTYIWIMLAVTAALVRIAGTQNNSKTA